MLGSREEFLLLFAHVCFFYGAKIKILHVEDGFSLSLSFSPTHKCSLGAGEKGSEVAGGCYSAVSEGLTLNPLMIDHHGYRGT